MEYLNCAFDLFVFISVVSAGWHVGKLAIKWVVGE